MGTSPVLNSNVGVGGGFFCCCCCCCGHASTTASGSVGRRSSSRHLILPLVLLVLAGYITTFDISFDYGTGSRLPATITKVLQRNRTKTVADKGPSDASDAAGATDASDTSQLASPDATLSSPEQRITPSQPTQQKASKLSPNRPPKTAKTKRNSSIQPPPVLSSMKASTKLDFGGLTMQFPLDKSDETLPPSPREIRSDDDDVYQREKVAQHETYANDADEEAFWGYHDHVDPTLQSVKSSQVTHMKPNCNLFYEQHWPNDDTVQGDMTDTIQYLASGYYRDTYQYSHFSSSTEPNAPSTLTTTIEMIVVKRQKFAQPISRKRLEKVRNEALAMEVLTSSPRVTLSYGHCGFSLLVEPAMRGLSHQIVPYYKEYQNYPGVLPQQNLNFHPEVLSLNNLTAVEKLDYALAMTESMADIHGLPTGPLVLMDVSLDQWLLTADGRLVLNDFDNSIFLGWRLLEERYSSVVSAHVGGFKAPEEVQGDTKLDERTDVWKMGDVLYTLLTGLQPYYNELHEERWDVIDDMLLAGTLPYIDARYETHGWIEGRLVQIMTQCFRREPRDRVTMFEVVQWLRDTKDASGSS